MTPGPHPSRPVEILLVEDHPGDARLFRELLAEGEFEAGLRWEETLADGLGAAREMSPDLMVLDLNLADSRGLDTVREVSRSLPDTPLVVMTGLTDLDVATAALGAGAAEYLRKDGLTPALLDRTLRMALERHRLQREAEEQRALNRSILRSLPEHIAVLEADGTIRSVNEAWRAFAESEGGDPRGYEGDDYLAVTERAADEDEDARAMLEGLRAVLDGERSHFALEYPCHGPEERRWFRVEVVPLREAGFEGAVVSHIDITERKERERFLATLTENLPGVLYRCRNDRDWTLEYLSAGVEALTGHRAEELLGPEPPNYADLIHPDDRERVWDDVQAAVEEGRPFQLEYRIRTAAGAEKWIWEQGQAVATEGEGPPHLEGYLVDVTEEVEARRETERAEEKWYSVFEASPLPMVISEAESGRLLEVNDAFVELFGQDRATMVDATSLGLGHWEDPERRRELVEKVREEGAFSGEEAWYRTDDGRRGLMLLGCRRLELAEGERLLWTVQDITEKRQRETALRESEERYRTLVETMAEATVILDREGRIAFANAEAEELLDLERSEMAARTYDDPEWRITSTEGGAFPASELPFRRVVETGQPVRNVEHAIVTHDGTRRILSINAAPLVVEEDRPQSVVATIRDVTEQKRLERQLQHRALHDPLTELANRTLLQDRLGQALARSRRTGQPMGLLMLDVVEFKRINDQLGHTAGDQVLQELSRRLELAVRDTDTVARWGGDEFAVVLPELDRPSAIEQLQGRIRDRVQAPMQAGDEQIEVNVNVGGVIHGESGHDRTVEVDDTEDLVRFADLALHRAKQTYPGNFYLYDPADELDEMPSLRLERDLRRGLREDEIEVFYQPIHRLPEGSVWGLEALARWRHPERGLLAPGDFVPLAERVGLIHEIGTAVGGAATAQMASWVRSGAADDDLRLALNLSGRELQDRELRDRLAGWLRASDFPADRLVIEVTETVLMKAPRRIDELKELGLAIHIDDFGTGYSTFTYLRELNADGLKIDMSFVRDLPRNQSDRAIVGSMVTLGRQLGLEVVAEGIETEAQLEALRDLDCALGQGYWFGRPVPAAEVPGAFLG